MAQPDTLMSRAAYNATYESDGRADQTQSFAGAKDEADRFQRMMWQEQVRMLYGGSDASWVTRWISRTLFIFGVLAISTMAFYVFFGESREVLSKRPLIAHQERPVITASLPALYSQGNPDPWMNASPSALLFREEAVRKR